VKANSHRFVSSLTTQRHLRSQLLCTLEPFIPRSKPAATRDHADPPRSRFDFHQRTEMCSAAGLRALGQAPFSPRVNELTPLLSRLTPASIPSAYRSVPTRRVRWEGQRGHTSETHDSPAPPDPVFAFTGSPAPLSSTHQAAVSYLRYFRPPMYADSTPVYGVITIWV
jgi:hypothetical protein